MFLFSAELALVASFFVLPGHAPATANYPNRPLRLIIAQVPGGNADIIDRALAEGLSDNLGQPLSWLRPLPFGYC